MVTDDIFTSLLIPNPARTVHLLYSSCSQVTVRRHLAYVVDLVKLTQTPFAGGKTRPIRGPFPSGG